MFLGRMAYKFFRQNEDLKEKIDYQEYTIDRLERSNAALKALPNVYDIYDKYRITYNELGMAKHEIDKMIYQIMDLKAQVADTAKIDTLKIELNKLVIQLASTHTKASAREQELANANEEQEKTIEGLRGTIEELREKISLLEAISTLAGSGMVPKDLSGDGQGEKVEGAVKTWRAGYERLEEAKEELKKSKAAASNVRKALAIGLRPGSPTVFDGVKKKEDLRVKAALFDASVKCEVYMGQLAEEKEARKEDAEKAQAELSEAQEACKVAEEAKEDLAMKLELANTEADVLRSWVEMLTASGERSCSTAGKVEKKRAAATVRASSSLPNMMISLARMQRAKLDEKLAVVAPLASPKGLEIRRKAASIPSIPSSMSVSFSLTDLADECFDEDKENSPAV